MLRSTVLTVAIAGLGISSACEKEEQPPCEPRGGSLHEVCVEGEWVCPVNEGKHVTAGGACLEMTEGDYGAFNLEVPCMQYFVLRRTGLDVDFYDQLSDESKPAGYNSDGEIVNTPVMYFDTPAGDSLSFSFSPFVESCTVEAFGSAVQPVPSVTFIGNDSARLTIRYVRTIPIAGSSPRDSFDVGGPRNNFYFTTAIADTVVYMTRFPGQAEDDE